MDDSTLIELLDQKISRLKLEYEQYFIKAAKREPAKLRADVDRMILEYGDRNISNTSLKFRLNSIVSRYNAYKQYWSRVLREIDDGTYKRRAEGADPGELNSYGQSSRPAEPGATAEIQSVPDGQTIPPEKAAGDDELRAVYLKYIEARNDCGEPVDGITFEALSRTIERNKRLVESKYNTKDVEIRVDRKDGKARVVITPKKRA